MGVTPARTVAARRIGVFGGAFDPPHTAHAALVQAAVADLQLDELRVIPTGQAWHKARPLSPAHHRLAMAQLAFSELPRVVVDPRETLRAGPSYTVDTLRELKLQWPDAELFLVMGEDQARALPTWHAWQDVLQLAIICVAEREDLTGARPRFIAQKSHESRFRRLRMPTMPVSATDIRARIAAHQSVSPLVFEPVARYIDNHHLYQTT
ncbi:nicotinate (nicotinamide) nucleotide adenylyltransferase [Rhodoferax sp. UBA5149]|uniref:nicotinate (nicotinamide) nucleotide adenylyltransferase n=1 Tax=Rhodoferax sp. UBA5149 TaxID=1947379 RepID=UPI0025D30F40|nr:nicotinate (nicotinamide) nucleotide adenylyltransferase [Rhodoferax sp. UBA5149]